MSRHEFWTTLYPGQKTLDTSTAPIGSWDKVILVMIKGGDMLYPVKFTFHPRKQTLDIHLNKSWQDFSHEIRVLVEATK